MQKLVRHLAVALGGRPAQSLASRLLLPVSKDTFLRSLRTGDDHAKAAPRIIGIDDWPWRKGQRYGTLICDLERHCVIDLLPDRTPATVEAWLRDHPGVECVARDRNGGYGSAVARALPEAAPSTRTRYNKFEYLVEKIAFELLPHHSDKPQAIRLRIDPLYQAATVSPPNNQATYEIVGELARYIAQARDAAVSSVARDAALQCIFDLIAASVVGFSDPGPSSLRQAAKELFRPGHATIWFANQTSSAIGAAWANSSAAAAKDLDDGNRYAAGHPGAAIIPAALATAQEVGATLDQTLTAIVIGYEVAVTVGTARTTYGSSGTWTPFGVVAAVAALRGTSLKAIEQALAIVGESAPNQSFAGGPAPRIPHPEGAAVKEGIPWGVVTGMTAVIMAEAGHTGPRNILDSRRHYVFPDDLRLGKSLHICQTYFKPYACCRHIHAPLAALHQVMADHGVTGTDIDAIHVETHAPALRISNKPDPENLVDVQYSIPFDLALSALHGPQMLTPVTEASLSLPGVRELARRVTLEKNEEFAAAYPETILGRVTLTCADRVLTSAPTPPEGEPLMSWDALRTKFHRATRFALTADRQQEIEAAITALRAGSMQPLLAQLSKAL